MKALPGINIIFHSIRPHGGMDRHVLDVISGFFSRGIPMRIIARVVDWKDKPSSNVEYVVLPDRTPFGRFNNDRFERNALRHINPDWPVIGISRVTGKVDVAIVGGTHIAHLADKGKRAGFFDKRVISNEKCLYQEAKVIVTHSQRVKNEIVRDYRIGPDRICTLYPPVDTRVFNVGWRSEREKIRRELNIRPGQFMLLFPSNNHTLKGADLILEALSRMDKPFVLAVAGRKEINHPKVLNLGYRENMPALYAAADASILASKYEAFGLVGPESICCGTPVLFADTIGAVEVLSQPACFRFSRTVESLCVTLETVYAKFRAGTLPVEKPDTHIHYPYSLHAYLDEISRMIQL